MSILFLYIIIYALYFLNYKPEKTCVSKKENFDVNKNFWTNPESYVGKDNCFEKYDMVEFY